jgi:hypothetical protein
MYVLLKGVAEAIEHCTQTQVKFTVVTAIYALEMAASSNLPHWTLSYNTRRQRGRYASQLNEGRLQDDFHRNQCN